MITLIAIYMFTIISMTTEMFWILTKGSHSSQTFSFIACQMLLNIWSASQIFLLLSVTKFQLFLSYSVGNTGICWIGTAWLIFSLFSVKAKISKRVVIPLVLFSTCMWIISLSNEFHHLYYSEFSLENVEHGPLFYVNIAFTYTCMIFGTMMLRRAITPDRHRRNQVHLLVLAAVIPLIANMLCLFGIVSTIYDLTPLAFSISSILVLLATDRYGFLNVNDIAFESALENIAEGVAVFGQNNVISYSNRIMRDYFELSENSHLCDLFDCFSSEQRASLSENCNKFSETEIQLSGRTLNLKKYCHCDKNGNRIAVTLIASDITRYYEMAEQKQALSDAKEKLAVERERNRIAQEVHDTAGHTLTMINSLAKLTDISVKNNDYNTAQQYAKEAQQLSSQGIAQLRVSINNLRKHSENSLLTVGLEQLAASTRGIEVELCIQGEDSAQYSFCSNVIYENTREAITNCVKYSEADRMDIIVKLFDDSAEVYIFDNGKGCESIIYGNGLKGMRERTEKAGGNIKFSSGIESGFSITMKFPVLKGKKYD